VAVSEEQARKYFESNPAQFQEPEQRRASHILIKLDADADEAARQAAKPAPNNCWRKCARRPASLPTWRASIRRIRVPAPGAAISAFSRDMMVKPFADAVWAMKTGEIQGLVESQFGFHIIRLDGIVGGAKLGFALVKDDIIASRCVSRKRSNVLSKPPSVSAIPSTSNRKALSRRRRNSA
jgi:peptidyl-prolyl cis-trans isomerase D